MCKKQLYNLKIDPELRDLLPPLTNDEYKRLENSILNNGYDKMKPICVWKGYIADGHNRYNICQKHGILFNIIRLGYETKSEVMRWMLEEQLGRRNLTPIQKVAITEKYRPFYEEKAKENLEKAGENFGIGKEKPLANLPNPINTRAELAKLAGTSERTYGKAASILHSNNEEVKQAVMGGKKSINAGYNEIKPKVEKPKMTINQESKVEPKPVQYTQLKTKKCLKCKQEKSFSEFTNGTDFCDKCMKNINAPIIDNSYIDTSTDVGKVIKDLKTPKVAADYIIIKNELLSIKESVQEMIDAAYERIFERYDLVEKMTQEDKNNAIIYMNQLNGEILKLKNKIEKIEIKGEI